MNPVLTKFVFCALALTVSFPASTLAQRKLFGKLPYPKPSTIPAPQGMVTVDGGGYWMGNSKSEWEYEGPAHYVGVPTFWMTKYEVTFDDYDTFCVATGRPLTEDRGWGRGQRPVIHVTWLDAVEYCNWRSQQEGLPMAYTVSSNRQVTCNFGSTGYRLPTEAEWEYAARGGMLTRYYPYPGGEDPRTVAHFFKYTRTPTTQEVGKRQPNELGLYDMAGNVWEWCWDYFSMDTYRKSSMRKSRYCDPQGPLQGEKRVVRGGGWCSNEIALEPHRRSAEDPGERSSAVGFRMVRTVPAQTVAMSLLQQPQR